MFSASSFGGTSLYDLKDFQSARFSSTLAAMGGTGEYNQIQLGKFLSGKQVNVCDAETGRVVGRPLQHTDIVTHIKMSHGGTSIAAAAEDGGVKVWPVPLV